MTTEPNKDGTETVEYYETCGLRCVVPYWYSFVVHVKGRWVGRTLFDVFSKEFPHQSEQYYKEAIACGNISIDGGVVAEDKILKHNEKIAHKMHRHEMPVFADKIPILGEDDNFIAISKPSSIPVHPCGRYAKNSLVSILHSSYNFPKTLHPVHRLDKATSGVLLFARTPQYAEKVGKILRQEVPDVGKKSITKQYLARVSGVFPENTIKCDYYVCCKDAKTGIMRSLIPGKDTMSDDVNNNLMTEAKQREELLKELAEYTESKLLQSEDDSNRDPTSKQKHKKNFGRSYTAKLRKKEVYKKLSSGKGGDAKMIPREATTLFKRIKVFENGKESLVLCQPLTGRTHQIRVHLQALGYPIVNDGLYNKDFLPNIPTDLINNLDIPTLPSTTLCSDCVSGETSLISSSFSSSSTMEIYLHALRYEFTVDEKDYSYTAPAPKWAEWSEHELSSIEMSLNKPEEAITNNSS